MISLPVIKQHIAAHSPTVLELSDNKHAAIALMLRQNNNEVEALFIERARHQADPWSGQMAFPGGMVEAFDVDARQAAERETAEEVGIDLSSEVYLGQLDDQQGRHRGHPHGIIIRGYVYAVEHKISAQRNYEVQDIVWVPIRRFLDARHYTQVVHPVEPDENFPGIRISGKEHQVVWGLTRRFIASFFYVINIQFDG